MPHQTQSAESCFHWWFRKKTCSSWQAILDPAKSITDPNYKKRSLPLWFISYWDRMHYVRKEQKPLRMQHDGWLRLRGHDSENKSAGMKIINESWALLGSLKWDTSIYLPGGAGWRWGWGRWVEFWSNSELEAYLNKFCFWGIFWKFFEGKSHNPDKITRFLGYPSYPDKIDKNWPKNNPDIRSFFPRYTS